MALANIIQLPTPIPGMQGTLPTPKFMVVGDNLATLTAANYLNAGNLEGFTVSPNDVLQVLYNYNIQTNVGTYTVCTVSISNGIITLTEDVSEGNVILPVTNGDFAVFSGTLGVIKDAGFLPSDATQQHVVMAKNATNSGHFANFADVNGTVTDSGFVPSDATKTKVAMASGSIVSGNLTKFSDVNGTVADQGFAMKSVSNMAINGSSTSITIADVFCTSGSNVVMCFSALTTNAYIVGITPGNGTISVTTNVAPGNSSSVNYIITK